MRLAEMKAGSRPNKAGLALIDWYSPEGGQSVPSREGDVLHLPRYFDAELFRLQPHYNQFLYCLRERTWFAGTDERPFLVRLGDGSFMRFLNGGPNGFYHSLIPEGLVKLAKKAGTRCQFDIPERQTYVRQGDIFAYPLSLTWGEIRRAFYILRGNEMETASGALEIFGTRHSLAFGRYLQGTHLLGRDLALVVEGTVVAPDHTSMKLETPHALFQTSGLFSPEEAD